MHTQALGCGAKSLSELAGVKVHAWVAQYHTLHTVERVTQGATGGLRCAHPAWVQYESCTPANDSPALLHAMAVSIMCALSTL